MKLKETKLKILKKIGSTFGINITYFIEHGFWVSLRFLVVGFFGLLLTIGFARLGSKELLGEYQYVLSVMALLSFLSFPGLNMVALREVSRGNSGAVKQVVRESFKWSWLALPIILGYGVFLYLKGDVILGEALVVAGILFPFYYPPNTWYVFYEGKSSFKPVTLRIIIQTIVISCAIIAGLYFKSKLTLIVLFFFGLGSIFNWIYYLKVAKESAGIVKSLDLKYGLSCTLQKFTFSLSDTLPQIIIFFLLGAEIVAVYQIAFVSISLIAAFVSALSATYMPLLFKYEKLNHSKFLLLNLFMGIVLFFCFGIFLKIFFMMLFGIQYESSYILAWIFSFIIMILPLRIYLINYFTAKSQNSIIIISYALANLLAPLVFYFAKSKGLIFSLSLYFYFSNIMFFLPLLVLYLKNVSKEKRLA